MHCLDSILYFYPNKMMGKHFILSVQKLLDLSNNFITISIDHIGIHGLILVKVPNDNQQVRQGRLIATNNNVQICQRSKEIFSSAINSVTISRVNLETLQIF